MGSKTISLKEETYERLRRTKGEDESFSDVIDRLVREEDHPLYGLVGLFDDGDVERVRESARRFREDAELRMGVDDGTDQ